MTDRLHSGHRYEALESAQHLRIGGIVWYLVVLRSTLLIIVNVKNNATYAINIADDCSDPRKACAATGHNADVFVRVLACFTLAVCVIIKVGNGFTEFWAWQVLDVNNIFDMRNTHAWCPLWVHIPARPREQGWCLVFLGRLVWDPLLGLLGLN